MKSRRRYRQRKRNHCTKGRVFHDLGEVFGMSQGTTIAVFVLGWVFVPLLTTLVFLGALYWVHSPEQAEHHARRISAWVARAAQQLSDAVAARPRRPVAEPDVAQPPHDQQSEPQQPRSAGELRRRFEALDRRAKSIEEFVASEEFRLEGEFRRMHE